MEIDPCVVRQEHRRLRTDRQAGGAEHGTQARQQRRHVPIGMVRGHLAPQRVDELGSRHGLAALEHQEDEDQARLPYRYALGDVDTVEHHVQRTAHLERAVGVSHVRTPFPA